MCHSSCTAFVAARLSHDDIAGKRVLEVGSRDVNGSVRGLIEAHAPASYTGVDIQAGEGVDEVCDVSGLLELFGSGSFDVVISTEMVEHVRDWRTAFRNLKGVLRPGGRILVTTRSRGFRLHGYPYDYWRYEPGDMHRIFADFEALVVEPDGEEPGVFVAARKPERPGPEAELDEVRLFSIIEKRRVREPHAAAETAHRLLRSVTRSSPVQALRDRLALGTRWRRRKAA